MTFDEWKAKASEFPTIGAAERWRQANGVEVEGLPAPTRTTGMATAPQPTGALPGALPGAAPQSEADRLREELLGYPAKQATERAARLKAGEERLAQMYGGPSTSQTLFALSQALLAPKPYRGFAGTLYNVSEALGGIQKQRTEAERAREAAAYKLQQQYEQEGSEDELNSLKLRYDLIKEANDLALAEAKAGRPSIQLDQAGNLREVPKNVERPRNKAEYDALPVGTYYVVPSGPDAGKIVPKTAP